MVSRGITIVLAALLTGLALPVAAQGGSWTAEYHDNVELAGNPVVVRSEVRPRGNWGEGSPHRGIPADHFAARWSTRVLLEAGTYLLNAQVDDGLRVYVNGEAVIDEWRDTGTGFFQLALPLEAGEHRLVVEYLELEGAAPRHLQHEPPCCPPPPADAPRARASRRAS